MSDTDTPSMSAPSLTEMEKEWQASILRCTNQLFVNLKIPTQPIRNFSELQKSASSMFVGIFETMFNLRLKNVARTPRVVNDYVNNAQLVIDALADSLSLDLSHVTGNGVYRGDGEQIQVLLDIFDNLWHQFFKRAATEGDHEEDDNDNEPANTSTEFEDEPQLQQDSSLLHASMSASSNGASVLNASAASLALEGAVNTLANSGRSGNHGIAPDAISSPGCSDEDSVPLSPRSARSARSGRSGGRLGSGLTLDALSADQHPRDEMLSSLSLSSHSKRGSALGLSRNSANNDIVSSAVSRGEGVKKSKRVKKQKKTKRNMAVIGVGLSRSVRNEVSGSGGRRRNSVGGRDRMRAHQPHQQSSQRRGGSARLGGSNISSGRRTNVSTRKQNGQPKSSAKSTRSRPVSNRQRLGGEGGGGVDAGNWENNGDNSENVKDVHEHNHDQPLTLQSLDQPKTNATQRPESPVNAQNNIDADVDADVTSQAMSGSPPRAPTYGGEQSEQTSRDNIERDVKLVEEKLQTAALRTLAKRYPDVYRRMYKTLHNKPPVTASSRHNLRGSSASGIDGLSKSVLSSAGSGSGVGRMSGKNLFSRRMQEDLERYGKSYKLLVRQHSSEVRVHARTKRTRAKAAVRSSIHDQKRERVRTQRLHDALRHKQRSAQRSRTSKEENLMRRLFENAVKLERTRLRAYQEAETERLHQLEQQHLNRYESGERRFLDRRQMLQEKLAEQVEEHKIVEQAQRVSLRQLSREVEQDYKQKLDMTLTQWEGKEQAQLLANSEKIEEEFDLLNKRVADMTAEQMRALKDVNDLSALSSRVNGSEGPAVEVDSFGSAAETAQRAAQTTRA